MDNCRVDPWRTREPLPGHRPGNADCSLRDPCAMCYVIVTSRTLVWTLLTLAATMAVLFAVLSPHWLVGAPRRVPAGARTSAFDANDVQHGDAFHRAAASNGSHGAGGTFFTPTVGIFNRCTQIHHLRDTFTFSCAPFVSSFSMPSDEFPGFWKASLIFFAIGLTFMTFTVGTSILGCCIRAIVRKSIFTISGTIQAVAALFYMLGLVVYPAGWGSERVKLLCGETADYYTMGECSFGWSFYLALMGIFLTVVASVISIYADSSTSSDKVQDEISEGRNLICLL